MCYLKIKANDCCYKEEGSRLKDQLINSINNNDMMIEVNKEPTTAKTMK